MGVVGGMTEYMFEYIRAMRPGHGHVWINRHKDRKNSPDYRGWARGDDGKVMMVSGWNIHQPGRQPSMSMMIKTLPAEDMRQVAYDEAVRAAWVAKVKEKWGIRKELENGAASGGK